MRPRLLLLALLSLTLVSCGLVTTQTLPGDDDESAGKLHIATAESTLTVFNDALAKRDTTAIDTLTADKFQIIIDGRRDNTAELITSVAADAPGATITRKCGNMTTHLKGRAAWSYYKVTVTVDDGKTKTETKRYETAVLTRTDEDWKVVLMTSQAVPEKD